MQAIRPTQISALDCGLKKQITVALSIFCCLCIAALGLPGATALAQSGSSFGPETFNRGPASKDVFNRTFTVPDASLPYTLTITNGQRDGSGRVRKGWITLNGAALLDPSVLRGQNYLINLAIHPQQQNTIEIKLKGGQPGSSITVSINPTVTALLTDPFSPEFNASEAGLGMPYGVVVKQATHEAYVADRYYDSVFEFDLQSTRITRRFAALDGDAVNGDGGTTGVAFDSSTNSLIAINEGVQDNSRGSIGIIDVVTGSVRTIPLLQSGQSLHSDYVAVNPTTNTAAFCTLYDGGRTARFIDLSSGSIQQSSPTMSQTAPVFNQNTRQFVVGARDDGSPPALIVYDGTAPFRQAQKVVSSAPAGTAFEKVAINPNTDIAVAINLPDRSASIFDLNAGVEIARIPVAVGMGQYGGADVAINPVTNMAIITSTFSPRMTVIDLNTMLPAWEISLPAGTRPLGIDIDYQLNRAVIAENGLSSNTRNGSILVIQLPTP